MEEMLYEPEYIVDMKPQRRELKKRGRKKRNRKLSVNNSLNLEERTGDASFCKDISKEQTPVIGASERLDFSSVAALICREQRKDTTRFKAELVDGSSAWIDDRDTHMHLKDQLIEFYERILNLKSREM
uniref:ChSh domain-containing protein n=1 Tax=Loa loa TaxID=7209 RepID=A0A1I7VLQ5_LOALO